MNLLPRVKGAVGAAFAAGLLYSLYEPHRLLVRHYTVALPGLSPESVGLKVVQLSDLHLSAITRPGVIRRAVEVCNAQQPDIVALTGDFVSRRNSYARPFFIRTWARPVMAYAAEVAQELRSLQASVGSFAVPGNHDHSQGRFDAIADLLCGAGVRPLLNTSAEVRGLPIIGLDDLRSGRIDPHVLDTVEADTPHLVLSHNPRVAPLLSHRNCLVLAGHTHAGQVHLPLTNFRRRPADMEASPLFQGWHRMGQAQLYINSGLGSVHFPMRFRCPPEVAVFTLVAA